MRRRHRPLRAATAVGALFVALLGVLAIAPDVARAQQGADRNRMTQGDSVRVRLTGRMTVRAAFDRWEHDGILLAVEGFTDPYQVALKDMQRLDVYMQRTSRESFRYGAMLGAAGGIFVGAAVGLLLHRSGVIDDPNAPPAEVVTDALTWMGLGLVGGTLIGGFYAGTHPGFGWIRIQLPAL